MDWLDWWQAAGGVAALVVVAATIDEHADHPEWLRALPILRYGVDLVLAAVVIPVVVAAVYAAVLFWQIVLGVAVIGLVLWFLVQVVRSGLDLLRSGGRHPSDGR